MQCNQLNATGDHAICPGPPIQCQNSLGTPEALYSQELCGDTVTSIHVALEIPEVRR